MRSAAPELTQDESNLQHCHISNHQAQIPPARNLSPVHHVSRHNSSQQPPAGQPVQTNKSGLSQPDVPGVNRVTPATSPAEVSDAKRETGSSMVDKLAYYRETLERRNRETEEVGGENGEIFRISK